MDIELRMDNLETKFRFVQDSLSRIEEKMDDFLVALKGSDDGQTRGVFARLDLIERWKALVIKVGLALLGSFFSLVGFVIFLLIEKGKI